MWPWHVLFRLYYYSLVARHQAAILRRQLLIWSFRVCKTRLMNSNQRSMQQRFPHQPRKPLTLREPNVTRPGAIGMCPALAEKSQNMTVEASTTTPTVRLLKVLGIR